MEMARRRQTLEDSRPLDALAGLTPSDPSVYIGKACTPDPHRGDSGRPRHLTSKATKTKSLCARERPNPDPESEETPALKLGKWHTMGFETNWFREPSKAKPRGIAQGRNYRTQRKPLADLATVRMDPLGPTLHGRCRMVFRGEPGSKLSKHFSHPPTS